MAREREVTILDIDKPEVKRKLRGAGARLTGRYKFRRIEYVIGGRLKGAHSWIRVRTDGKRHSITYKELSSKGGFTPMEEIEVDADNFENAVRIMSKLAKRKIVYSENEREEYRLGSVAITINKWPKIPALVEIEGPSQEAVKRAYRDLAIKGKFVGNISIAKIYKRYGKDYLSINLNDKLERILSS